MNAIRGRMWVAVLCLALAACAEQPDSGDGGGDGMPGEPATKMDPAELIGVWTVTGADGEDDEDQVLARISGQELRLSRECGYVSGSWRADHGGLFVAYVSGLSAGCRHLDPPTPAWLRQATSFELDGDDRVLVDASGEVTARLVPAPTATASPDRQTFPPAAPVPQGLTPAEPAAPAGRWVPESGTTEGVYLELAADGGWQGSDGCNPQAGRWVAGSDGALLAVSGPVTLVACPGQPVGTWLVAASRAGLDGDVLVLLDAGGDETGRLRRA